MLQEGGKGWSGPCAAQKGGKTQGSLAAGKEKLKFQNLLENICLGSRRGPGGCQGDHEAAAKEGLGCARGMLQVREGILPLCTPGATQGWHKGGEKDGHVSSGESWDRGKLQDPIHAHGHCREGQRDRDRLCALGAQMGTEELPWNIWEHFFPVDEKPRVPRGAVGSFPSL